MRKRFSIAGLQLSGERLCYLGESENRSSMNRGWDLKELVLTVHHFWRFKQQDLEGGTKLVRGELLYCRELTSGSPGITVQPTPSSLLVLFS